MKQIKVTMTMDYEESEIIYCDSLLDAITMCQKATNEDGYSLVNEVMGHGIIRYEVAIQNFDTSELAIVGSIYLEW